MVIPYVRLYFLVRDTIIRGNFCGLLRREFFLMHAFWPRVRNITDITRLFLQCDEEMPNDSKTL